jgi:arsenate reductase
MGAISVGAISVGAISMGAISVGAISVGAISVGAISVGAISVGAISIGAISIGAISARRNEEKNEEKQVPFSLLCCQIVSIPDLHQKGMSAHLYICTSAHLHIRTSADLHICPSAQKGKTEMMTEHDKWMKEAKTLHAQKPRGLLFLCVANAARSQMAEGIARALAPAGVAIFSAGSKPTRVHPEAKAVLAEIGIDISTHRSKAVSEISADQVDTVITLCAAEECPLFLGAATATRLYWGLPDPAAVDGDSTVRLDAFRQIRDELCRRLAVVFGNGSKKTNVREHRTNDE